MSDPLLPEAEHLLKAPALPVGWLTRLMAVAGLCERTEWVLDHDGKLAFATIHRHRPPPQPMRLRWLRRLIGVPVHLAGCGLAVIGEIVAGEDIWLP